MRHIKDLVAEHRRHIIASVALSLAIFVALILGQHFGLGGITINPWLLFAGFLLAEVGRSATCFGQQLKRRRLEYAGVFVQGLAWWVWCLNLTFLKDMSGRERALHLGFSALLIGLLPCVMHYLTQEVLAVTGFGPGKKSLAKHAEPDRKASLKPNT